MELKSVLIIDELKRKSLDIDNLPEEVELCIDAKDLIKVEYREENINIIEDLNLILNNKISTLEFRNMILEETIEMCEIMKKIGENVNKFKVTNSYIANLDSYMYGVSEKNEESEVLLKKQYIKEFSYKKDVKRIILSAQNLNMISALAKYINLQKLKIKVYDKCDIKYIHEHIDEIRNLKIQKNIIMDNEEENILNKFEYENYINEKVVLFQSKLVKKSMELNKLPISTVNNVSYNIELDGNKVNSNIAYVLSGEEENFFIRDMQDLIKYINISSIDFKNIIFQDNEEVKKVLTDVVAKELKVDYTVPVENRNFIKIIKEKLYKVFKINFGFKKNQKALPIYTEKN